MGHNCYCKSRTKSKKRLPGGKHFAHSEKKRIQYAAGALVSLAWPSETLWERGSSVWVQKQTLRLKKFKLWHKGKAALYGKQFDEKRIT